jgi:hypothetical protein
MLREFQTAAKRVVNFRDGVTGLHMELWGVAVSVTDLMDLACIS